MQRGMNAAVTLGLCLALGAGLSGCASMGGGASDHEVRKAASHVQIGVDHLANGRAARALREFLAAEKLDPDNAQVHYGLSDAYLRRGKRAEAEVHLRRALELFPDYHDARQSLVAMLLVDRRYEESIEHSEHLVADPTYHMPERALGNRAWAEYKLGRIQESRDSLQLALEYRGDYWPATLALAIIESQTGRRLQAIRLYHDIIAMEPGAIVESEVNYRLAEIYVALGKRSKAMGHLTASVARSPEGPWAKKSQDYLKLLH